MQQFINITNEQGHRLHSFNERLQNILDGLLGAQPRAERATEDTKASGYLEAIGNNLRDVEHLLDAVNNKIEILENVLSIPTDGPSKGAEISR